MITRVGHIETIVLIWEGWKKGVYTIKMYFMKFSKMNKSKKKDKHIYTKNENTVPKSLIISTYIL